MIKKKRKKAKKYLRQKNKANNRPQRCERHQLKFSADDFPHSTESTTTFPPSGEGRCYFGDQINAHEAPDLDDMSLLLEDRQ